MVQAAFPGVSGRRFGYRSSYGPLTDQQRAWLAGARWLARVMDTQFSIFGFRFGFDPLVGLVPWVGDAVMALSSLYMLWVGVQLELPPAKLARMAANIAVDLTFSLVPVVGDLADMVFKAYVRNLRILEEHVRELEGPVEAEVLRR